MYRERPIGAFVPHCERWTSTLGLHPGTTIDAYAAAALAGTGLQDAAGHLDALYGEGLLTEVGYRRYGMHDLISRYARDLAAAGPAAGREQALERLLGYYQLGSRPGQAGVLGNLGAVRRLTGDYPGAFQTRTGIWPGSARHQAGLS